MAVLAVGLAAVLLVSLVRVSTAHAGSPDVPEEVLCGAHRLIQSRVGAAFAEKYVAAAPDTVSFVRQRGSQEQQYELRFLLVVPELDLSDDVICFTLDSRGAVVSGSQIRGLPDCSTKPDECELHVSREEAMCIAERLWGQARTDRWRADVRWNGIAGFVWEISASWLQSPDKLRGVSAQIDIGTGEVITSRASIGFLNRV